MRDWKDAVDQDESADHVTIAAGVKRKAVSVGSVGLGGS